VIFRLVSDLAVVRQDKSVDSSSKEDHLVEIKKSNGRKTFLCSSNMCFGTGITL
jgi:hypothetical protein